MRCHGVDNGLDARDLLVVHFVRNILQIGKWPDSWQHADQTLQRAHFLHLPQLIAEVFQRETVATQRLAGKLFRFLLVNVLFRFLD